jgi:hypothetical protein
LSAKILTCPEWYRARKQIAEEQSVPLLRVTTLEREAARVKPQKRPRRARVKPDENQELMIICRFLELVAAAKPKEHVAIERAIMTAAVGHLDGTALDRLDTAARHLGRVVRERRRDMVQLHPVA